MITISQEAEQYFATLIEQQGSEGMNLRLMVQRPGTPSARISLNFCAIGAEQAEDVVQQCQGFILYIDGPSTVALEQAQIDYRHTQAGTQLVIDAPKMKLPQLHADSPLSDRINFILYDEINPSLAAHGGYVELIDIIDDSIAILEFGGGCQGCAQVDQTLKQGVEASLLQRLPELKAVRDSTDHSHAENAYYKSSQD